VAEGHSNAQLARMLWVTEQTVKFHLSNIYRKLEVSNRTEASRWAQLNGLLMKDSQAAERTGLGTS
jgi:DNA-binding CsgD family transcriptional regulator